MLDEPLGALDALTQPEMQALIEKIWLERWFSVGLVTHQVEEAVALADRVLVMEHDQYLFEQIPLPRPFGQGFRQSGHENDCALLRAVNFGKFSFIK